MASGPAGAPARTSLLALGALGVVFGDIGTSPLYAFRESVQALGGGPEEARVLGILSLIFWALVLVVSVKYLQFVTRADNEGEGGVFALLALSQAGAAPAPPGHRRARLGFGIVVTLVGASLLSGEAVLTPAISVLAAAEGFKTIHEGFRPFVVPIACLILLLLFLVQRQGTGRIGSWFGPVMIIWFATLGVLGIIQVMGAPAVLASVNPMYAIALLVGEPALIVPLLGSVVLAITGVEALYADMGHFGRRAITWAWYGAALPGLWLNYLGQGALVLRQPDSFGHTFYSLAPAGAPRTVLVFLSIAATVIASQALISGAFSLVRQAIQLGYFPRLTVLHTNARQSGQIYIPLVNWLLAFGSIATVLGFRSSDALAHAYGIAVTGTMTMTSLAFFLVVRRRWGWSWARGAALCGAFLLVDVSFLGANLHKVLEGGWLPLAIGAVLIAVMRAWKKGRTEIQEKIYGQGDTEVELSAIARSQHLVRVPGAAVFMAANPRGTPLALLHHLKANRVLHQTVVLLSVVTDALPSIPEHSRVGLEECGEGVWRVVVRYGYMESPEVGAVIGRLREVGVPIDPEEAIYFFNREMIVTGGNARMWEWEKRLYAFLSRNARPARDYYQIPPSQIIEIGLPVQL